MQRARLSRSLSLGIHNSLVRSSTIYRATSVCYSSTKSSSSTSGGSLVRPDVSHTYKHDRKEAVGQAVPDKHVKPTLASFSLEGKTAVVTGGARGLGLVMAQALMLSGADVAIVDLNGECRFMLGGISNQD